MEEVFRKKIEKGSRNPFDEKEEQSPFRSTNK